MANEVQSRCGYLKSVSLVMLGWIAFVLGNCIPMPIGIKLVLLAATRVLP